MREETLIVLGFAMALVGLLWQWTPTVIFGWMLIWIGNEVDRAKRGK